MNINLEKQICGISHFFREEWCGNSKNIQITALHLNLNFDNEYWNDFKGIQQIRQGNASVFDINFLRIMFFKGSISYSQDDINKTYYENQPFSITTKKNTEIGYWVLVLSESSLLEPTNNANWLIPIFQYVLDKDIFKEHTFSYEYNFNSCKNDGMYTVNIPLDIKIVKIPTILKSEQDLSDFIKIVEKLESDKLKNKVKLSLTWFSKTLNSNSYERFLYFWFAMEILKLENRKSEIIPIKTALHKIYPASKEIYSEIAGKLLKLRCKIVHEGKTPNIDNKFNEYCIAFYFDILLDSLQLKPEYLLDKFKLNNDAFDIMKDLNLFLK